MRSSRAAAPSLSRQCPALALEWHPTKNAPLTPDDVSRGSKRRVWWACPKGPDHEWESEIFGRAQRGWGCPFCCGRRASVTNSIAALRPELAQQWHPTKNAPLTAHDVPVGSHAHAWWICPAGPDHEWEAAIVGRSERGWGCPFCSGHRMSLENSLAVLRPELASEWHPTKNAPLTPHDVSPGTNLKAWWLCARDPNHVFRATITNRTRPSVSGGRIGCPHCYKTRPTLRKKGSLGQRNPDIARQWHPDKNGDLTPNDVGAKSTTRVWWKCPEGPDHEWEGTVTSRVTWKSGCPFCISKRACWSNSLAALHPAVAAEWHPTKNHPLKADAVVPGSQKMAWWKCPAGDDHIWEAQVCRRVRGRCPFCAGRAASATNCLAKIAPKLAAEWDHEANGDVGPNGVVAMSKDAYWWRCVLGHRWRASPGARIAQKQGCPVCAALLFLGGGR